MDDMATARNDPARLAGGLPARARSAVSRPTWVHGGLVLAGLTRATHLANFAFTIAGGRLLAPAAFATLTALLGIVLVGMAPGMALQALTAAGTLGRPVVIDRALARRLALAIAVVVMAILARLGASLGTADPVIFMATATAAGLLVLTAANEGILQGTSRFSGLGMVLLTGASVKMATGVAGMAGTHAVRVAAVAIMAGYATQLVASRRLTGGLAPRVPRSRMSATVAIAMAMTGGLLAIVHVDALLARILLEPRAAGMYAVGTSAMRIVFWAPQFVLLLLFPRMVRDHRPRIVATAVAGLAGVGALLAAAARMAGPSVVALVFGTGFASIGVDLWRFAWLGTAAVCLQVLVLADLAQGRHDTLWVLATTLGLIVMTLLVTNPGTPAAVVTPVAAIVTAAVLIGLARHVTRHTPHPSDPHPSDPHPCLEATHA